LLIYRALIERQAAHKTMALYIDKSLKRRANV